MKLRPLVIATCFMLLPAIAAGADTARDYKKISEKIEKLYYKDRENHKSISAVKDEVVAGISCKSSAAYLGLLMLYKYGLIDDSDIEIHTPLGQALIGTLAYSLSKKYIISYAWVGSVIGEAFDPEVRKRDKPF